MKTILLVEHEGDHKEYALKKACERGYRIILATNTNSDIFKNYVSPEDILITNTLSSQELILDVVSFLCEKDIKLDALGTFRENVVIQTADLAEALELPGVGSGAARRSSQNKLLMRETLNKHGFLSQPRFKAINIYNSEHKAALEEFPKPCVIKPLYGTASFGVKMLTSNKDLVIDIEEVKSTIQSSTREAFKYFKGEMILEEYVPGRVISIDGIVCDEKIHIIGSIDFIMGEEPYFVQESSFIPAQLSREERNQCENFTKQIIEILSFQTAGFHCELRLTNDGPILLEIAARLPGAGIYSTYDHVYGIDLIGMMFDAWLGNIIPIGFESRFINFHKNVQITSENKKVLQSLNNIQKVRDQLKINHINQVAIQGQVISSDLSHPTILYDYSIIGDTYDYLLKEANNLESIISYKFE